MFPDNKKKSTEIFYLFGKKKIKIIYKSEKYIILFMWREFKE